MSEKDAKISTRVPDLTIVPPPSRPLTTLRKLVRDSSERASVERCELCSIPLAAEHQHLIEPASRRLKCVCDACAVLFDQPAGGRYRRVPRRSCLLKDFALSESQWQQFQIPINMAFFFPSTVAERIVAIYPSPAGATEALVDRDAWYGLAAANPALDRLEADVEALLVNRLGARYGFAECEYFISPIDVCYQLVGLLRTHWRGFSGGAEVWQHIARFYSELRQRSATVVAAPAKTNAVVTADGQYENSAASTATAIISGETRDA